ncbi:hypothetical protein [Nocardia sp. NPDC005978]|uniref:hypothetical protein n=1 Tax=unclassified Nocardia TaxID=2637762 RepID=UPI0033BB285F
MRSAIGYLRSDLAGARQRRHETEIRYAAAMAGYDLRKIAAFSDRTDDRIHRIRVMLDRLGVDAVITPSLDHLESAIVPTALTEVADVLTIEPARTYPRTPPTTTTEG